MSMSMSMSMSMRTSKEYINTELELTNPNWERRLSAAKRCSYKFLEDNLHAIIRGLSDNSEQVRAEFENLIDLAIHDKRVGNTGFRYMLFSARSIKFTDKQLNIGINDPNKKVRLAVMKRKDFNPTKKQLESFANSGDAECLAVLLSMHVDFILPPHLKEILNTNAEADEPNVPNQCPARETTSEPKAATRTSPSI